MTGVLLLIIRILAVITLYTFLGVTLYYLWVSIQQDTSVLEVNEIHKIGFFVKNDNDIDEEIQFQKVNIEIGRDNHCDITLNHSTVSNRHARLSFHHSHWWLDDLLSTNGTKLNGEYIKNPAIIINGDVISCGKIDLTVLLPEEPNSIQGELE